MTGPWTPKPPQPAWVRPTAKVLTWGISYTVLILAMCLVRWAWFFSAMVSP